MIQCTHGLRPVEATTVVPGIHELSRPRSIRQPFPPASGRSVCEPTWPRRLQFGCQDGRGGVEGPRVPEELASPRSFSALDPFR